VSQPLSRARLERLRARECRLTSDRALRSLDDAERFLTERGLLTRFPDSALPSLFGACHEAPGRAGGRGFDLWPKTRWIWSFQLARRPGVVLTKLHRGKSLYLSAEAAAVLDPLVRRAMAAATGDDLRVLEHLASHGASMNDDLELELQWDRKHLKRARNRLERVGAVVSDGLVFEDASNWSFAPMRRWDQVVAEPPRPPGGDPYADLAMVGMRAAVLAPEAEIQNWFSWPIPAGTVDKLVATGRLTRPSPGWLAITEAKGHARRDTGGRGGGGRGGVWFHHIEDRCRKT